MKKILTSLLLFGLLWLCSLYMASQEEKKDLKTEIKISTEIPKLSLPIYTPGGRRDPFKDLLARSGGQARAGVEASPGEPGRQPLITFENLRLVGIIKVGRQYTAVMVGAQEFPLYVRVGHRFSDGFIRSIDESKVVFRRLREGGTPLAKPRDIVKELIL